MTFKPVDTAIVMVVGPCIDDTDFKSLEEAIAYDAAGMDVSLIVEKTDGTTSVTAITLTTAGTSDWTHKDGGYYEIEVTAAQNAEEGIAYIRGICGGVLPFESPRYSIVKANVYDSLIKGTDVLQTDVTQLAGVAQSLTDLKDLADTGYDPVNHKIQSDLIYIHGSALTETAGQLAAAFTKLFNVATPLLIASDVMRGTNDAALAATALTDLTWTDAKAAFLDAAISSRSVPNEYDTVIAALQTDLDNPAQYKADVSALATAAAISTHDGKLDTVDTNVDSILLDTDELQIDWTNGGRLDLLIDRLIAANEVEATTVTGATSSTIFAATSLLDDTDDHYNDGVMVFTSGANRGQPKRILDFTGATKEITVSAAFETTPSIGDSFVITTQLAAAAAAGGDATATNQVAMIAILDAIKGSGWIQANHSLAERPVGGAGGGGHCAWYDDDLNRANKFFKASPSKFKEILENLDSIKTKLSKVNSDSSIIDSISKNNSTLSDDLNTIQASISELTEGLKTTDSLLIAMADAASLEELLDEA